MRARRAETAVEAVTLWTLLAGLVPALDPEPDPLLPRSGDPGTGTGAPGAGGGAEPGAGVGPVPGTLVAASWGAPVGVLVMVCPLTTVVLRGSNVRGAMSGFLSNGGMPQLRSSSNGLCSWAETTAMQAATRASSTESFFTVVIITS